MVYIVNRKRFATLADACAYANAYWRKTGVFVAVEAKPQVSKSDAGHPDNVIL